MRNGCRAPSEVAALEDIDHSVAVRVLAQVHTNHEQRFIDYYLEQVTPYLYVTSEGPQQAAQSVFALCSTEIAGTSARCRGSRPLIQYDISFREGSNLQPGVSCAGSQSFIKQELEKRPLLRQHHVAPC